MSSFVLPIFSNSYFTKALAYLAGISDFLDLESIVFIWANEPVPVSLYSRGDGAGLILKPLMNLAFSGNKMQTIEEIVVVLMKNLAGYFR